MTAIPILLQSAVLVSLLLFAQRTIAATTVGPLAPISIAKLPTYSTARPCAAKCIVYQGVWACGVNSGYSDLGYDLGCGCSPNNACYCSEGYQSQVTSYISSCVSAGCSKFGNLNSDITSMLGLYDGYCATANVELSTSTPAVTDAKTTQGTQKETGASTTGGKSTSTAANPADSAQSTQAEADKGEEGLSKSDIIALGTGLGIGIPSLVVGALALWFQIRRRNAAAASPQNKVEITPAESQTHFFNGPPPQEMEHSQGPGPVYELSEHNARGLR